jgi:Tol biopolymer transport system component
VLVVRRIIPLLALPLAAGAAQASAAPGDISIASRSSGGTLGDQPVAGTAVSADGTRVAFVSAADLTGVATGGVAQLYVRDLAAGTTTLASASAAGGAANGAVESDGGLTATQFALSGDGRYAVFASTATNLALGDTDANLDVYRKDLATGAVDLVSVATGGAKANAAVAGDPDVSYDGTRVAFGSGLATNLIPADANGATTDIVVRDVAAGTTVLAAQSTAGVQSNGVTERPAMSADGRVVAFTANNTDNLYPGDQATNNDTIVRDLAAGTTSLASDPAQPTNFPDVSGDGRFVVAEVGGQVVRRDVGAATDLVVSARDGLATGGNGNSRRPSISADGTRVAFSSTSTDLTGADADATEDVFARTLPTSTALQSVQANGTTKSATNASGTPGIAGNGGLVAFVFDATGSATLLVPGDANNQPDAFAKEVAPTDATGPAVTISSPAAGATTESDQATIAGTATDASGVAVLTVAGQQVARAADGSFQATVPLVVGANAIEVRATDGSGNTTSSTVTVTRNLPPAPPAPAPAPGAPGPAAPIEAGAPPVTLTPAARAGALVLRGRVGRRVVSVRFRLSGAARVKAQLYRRIVARRPKKVTPSRRVILRRVARPVTRNLAAGRRRIVFRAKKTLRPGRYVVRLRVTSPEGTTRATRSIVLRRRTR